MADVREIELEALSKIQVASYGLLRSESESDVMVELGKVLRLAPLVNGYFRVQPEGLKLICMTTPPGGVDLAGAPQQVLMSISEIAATFAEGLGTCTLDRKGALPEPIRQALLRAGCEKAAYIRVMDGVEPVGVIILGAKAGESLTDHTFLPFIGLAELLPLALDKVRTSHETQQRLRELESIASVSQAVSTADSLDNLYRIIHQKVRETVGEVSIIFALYDKPTDTIQIPYRYEDGEYSTIESFPLGEGLTSILIRSQQPLLIVEDTERRAAELGAKVVGKAAKSWLGCPLLVAGEPVGAMIIQDTERERRFGQDGLRFITSLAAQTAGAISNARLLEETRRRAVQLETAAEISRDVSGSLVVDELLQKSVNLIRERFSFYHAAIFFVDASGQTASIREASGAVGIEMKHAGHSLEVGSNSIVGHVTSEGRPLVVNETRKSAIHFPNPLLPDTRSEAAIPIKVGERIIGALDVQSTEPFAFNDENINIIQILADQIGIAIVNSELFAEAQERLSQHRLLHHVTTSAASSTTIEDALNSAVQGLQVTLGGDQVSILMRDPNREALIVRSAIGYSEDVYRLRVPMGTGITGWVAEHRQPLRIGDVRTDPRFISVSEHTRSEMAIPLIYRNEVLGVLNVESPRVDAYGESIEEMIGTLAGSLAAIIAHSQLLEQYRRQIAHDRLLYEITTKVRRTTNIQSIMEITANEIIRAIGAERASISLDIHPNGD